MSKHEMYHFPLAPTTKVNEIVVCIFHGKLLGLLADFATEPPVRRQSHDGRAHFEPRET